MKLLTRDEDKTYLMGLKALLEENGIPSIVLGENTARIFPPFVMTQPGLWVYLDHQFDDAAHLMMDADYKVSTGIDVDEFYKNQPSEEEQTNLLNKALIHLLLYALLFCAGIFAFILVMDKL